MTLGKLLLVLLVVLVPLTACSALGDPETMYTITCTQPPVTFEAHMLDYFRAEIKISAVHPDETQWRVEYGSKGEEDTIWEYGDLIYEYHYLQQGTFIATAVVIDHHNKCKSILTSGPLTIMTEEEYNQIYGSTNK